MENQVQVAANTGEVANPQHSTETSTENVSAEQTTVQTQQEDITQTQAFARRLKEATTEAEKRARDALIAEMFGESHGIRTYEEYQRAIQAQREAEERQRYEQAGLDPDLINQLLEKHPAVQFANQLQQRQMEEQRFQAEVNELFTEVPGIKPEDIQPEVWKLRQERGLTLLDAYLRVNFKTIAQQKEQEAIQKITQNAQSSTGPLSGGDVQHNTSIAKMTKSDFQKLVEQVKRGEITSL